MLLWDIIRDWFVQYIFGGTTSTNEFYYGTLGYINTDGNGDFSILNNELYLPINGYNDSTSEKINYLNFSDWLSTTSTIIVLIMICVFFFICVRYLFKVGAGLFHNMRG